MISVMLVDDEQLVLEDLTDIVDWESLGFRIVATARNGKQALLKYALLQPELVITDIQMSGIDGVELARKLRESERKPTVVLLSAYSDFDYAKRALKYGVDDYLLKNEISNEMLTDKLKELRERVEGARKTDNLLLKETIAGLIGGTAGKYDGRAEEFLSEARYYFVVERDIPCMFAMGADDGVQQTVAESEAFYRANITELTVRTVVKLKDGRMLVCIDPPKEHSQLTLEAALAGQARRLLAELMRQSDESYTIYISYQKQTLYEFSHLYRQRRKALRAKYFLCGCRVYDIMCAELQCGEQNSTLELDRFLSILNANDSKLAIEYIEKMYADAIANMSYGELLNISNAFYITLASLVEKHSGVQLPDISVSGNMQYWKQAQSIEQWMVDRYTAVMKAVGHGDGSKLSAAVSGAVDYIGKNYGSDNLKIDAIAESIGISASRLSVLFKNEMDCTVGEYITSFRMWKAQLLLREGKYKVYEVAEMVGYGTSQYFSQIFCQKVGVSPKEYSKGVAGA